MKYKTEQENFWAGEFGSEYIQRNKSEQLMASNLSFFSKSLAKAGKISQVIEFGSNIGMNLKALKLLYPEQEQYAVEINADAEKELVAFLGKDNVFNESILEFNTDIKADLCLIKGVLIHINPDSLDDVYSILYSSSEKYILMCEYYNPSPVQIDYRGNRDKLFKRDFAGEFMDKFKDVVLVDYGFVYKRDPAFPQDDISWFLMEKTN